MKLAAVIVLSSALSLSCGGRSGSVQAPGTTPLLEEKAVTPIDCPLRAKGVDVHGLRPFEEVEEYIAFLERPDRANWQRPMEVIAALDLRGDETVTDLGAGSGYFTFRIASSLPRGRVRATDIDPEMVRHIHHRVTSEGFSNVEAVLSTAAEPDVIAETDLVFICDVLHHVQDRQLWLRRVFELLEPGARLVLLEFKEGDLPEGPPEALKITKGEIVALAEAAGFRLTDDRSELLPYQTFLIFVRPGERVT